MDRYISIDEEGYLAFDGRRVDDEGLGRTLIGNLRLDETNSLQTSMDDNTAFVEAFDEPLIARHVRMNGENGEIDLPYGLTAKFDFATLCLDEWDRFHGRTSANVPFVFSRQAQVEFFDLLEQFDDDSVTVNGRRYPVPAWLAPNVDVKSEGFWSHIYRTEQPGWELEREHPALPEALPQLKIVKSRILVLGAGSGNDAAYFAKQGHVVTAVDFSPEAVARAKAKYGSIDNLKFVQHDAFQLPESWTGQYDLVFEHTCFCAVSPDKRNDLIKVWRRMLQPQGHLLGVFFTFEKRVGPPYGGSEWELRERLKNGFSFLYWTRWRRSLERRRGKELVVYARKKD